MLTSSPALLLAAAVVLQVARDRAFGTDVPAEQVLYVQSPEVARRLALSFDALAADVYWIRALQHFGGTRKATAQERNYELLYPLLDMATGARPVLQHRLPLRRDLPVRAEAGRARPARSRR